jgi:hypothetical protein
MSKINIAAIIIPLRVPLIVHSNSSPAHRSSTIWSVKTATKQATYIPSEIRYGLGFGGGSSLDCELGMSEWNTSIALDDHTNHNWVSSWTRLVSIQLPINSGYNFIVTHAKYLVGRTKDGENVLFIYSGTSSKYCQVVFNKVTNEVIKCDCDTSSPCIHMKAAVELIAKFNLNAVLKS